MTEMTHKPGNISCSEARELLSDLIDARRGELPHPDGTRLAEPGMRAAMELHVAACENCREEIETLEEIGAAFADYNVGELPVQAFADYGQRARDRMKGIAPVRKQGVRKDFFWRQRTFWMTLASSGLIAASLFVLIRPSLTSNTRPLSPYQPTVAKARIKTKVIYPEPIQFRAADGAQMVSLINPTDRNEMQRLQQFEARAPFLLFPAPLLGAMLQTSRDTDRVVDEEPIGIRVAEVTPGSPAEAMGLQAGDLIVQWNEFPVANGSAGETVKFLQGINRLGARAPISLHVIRPEGSQFVYRKPMAAVLGEYEDR